MALFTCFLEEINHLRPSRKRTNFDAFLSSVQRTDYVKRTPSTPSPNLVFCRNNSSTSSLSTRSRSATSSTISSAPTSPISQFTPTAPQFESKSSPIDSHEFSWPKQHDPRGSERVRRETESVPVSASPTSSSSLSALAEEKLPCAQVEDRPCRNCYKLHKGSSLQSSTCFFISAQSHRLPPLTGSQSPRNETITLPIPSSPARTSELCKSIWNCFEAMRAENDAIRKWISGSSPPQSPQKQPVYGHWPNPNVKQKISLRAEAPLIWLKWRASDGLRKGQTRSERNWEDIWHQVLPKQDTSQSEAETLSKTTGHLGWISISFPPEHMQALLKAVGEECNS